MAKIPTPTDNIANRIYTAYEQRGAAEAPRPHLGASIMGHHCERYIWLQFRWAVIEKFEGRMLRLFNRGHREEALLVKDLRDAGLDIHDFDPKTRKQFNIKDGHLGGSLDGIIYQGVPEAPKKRHIAEFKTHSLKSFDALVKDGVEKAKLQHYVQMQVYMHYTGIDRALYVAVCKNDDHIFTERVRYAKEKALSFIERAKRLASSDNIPPPITSDPTWWQCKMCPAHSFCHQKQPAKEINCRTCSNVTAEADGSWHCVKWGDTIPTPEAQLEGCDHHVLHPDLVPWRMKLTEDGEGAIYVIDGKEVLNSAKGYKSREIIANPLACTGDKTIEHIKAVFPDAEVIG
jgi:hypothetical protein